MKQLEILFMTLSCSYCGLNVQYITSASWFLHVHQSAMEYNRTFALWKCIMNPDIDMDDVQEAREGVEHDFMVIDNVLGDLNKN